MRIIRFSIRMLKEDLSLVWCGRHRYQWPRRCQSPGVGDGICSLGAARVHLHSRVIVHDWLPDHPCALYPTRRLATTESDLGRVYVHVRRSRRLTSSTSSLTTCSRRCPPIPPSVSRSILSRTAVRHADYANCTRRNEMIIDLAPAPSLSWLYLASWFSRSNPCGRPIALAPTIDQKQGHASKTKIDGIRNLWG